MIMPGNKYYTHVENKLEWIKQMAREGLIDKDIAHNLGVAESTFNGYKKKYPELAKALRDSKPEADAKVESALFKKALGYNVEVKKTFKCKHTTYDSTTGKKIAEDEVLETGIDEVHIPADTTAQIFWLKNRVPDKWRDKQEIEHSGDETLSKVDEILKGIQDHAAK